MEKHMKRTLTAVIAATALSAAVVPATVAMGQELPQLQQSVKNGLAQRGFEVTDMQIMELTEAQVSELNDIVNNSGGGGQGDERIKQIFGME
jgi:Spy/CpxP family protein refolding chaperone